VGRASSSGTYFDKGLDKKKPNPGLAKLSCKEAKMARKDRICLSEELAKLPNEAGTAGFMRAALDRALYAPMQLEAERIAGARTL
jgi:hypothetical protein